MTSADGRFEIAKGRRWRSPGGLVTIGTVLALVAGLGLTALGLGAADQAVASYDAASWVWSKTRGEMARINGITAKVDTRVDVPKARAHTMEVSQSDRYVMLRDVNTGVVSSMDLTSLQVYATMPTSSGIGVRVALRDDAAFVIDAVRGEVRQLDPQTLNPIGPTLRYPPGITGGVFDGTGRLWIAVPGEGTVSAITPAALPNGSNKKGGSALGPKQISTASVAPPSHDLAISALDKGVAVLNRTTNALTTITGDRRTTTPLPLTGPGTLPAQIDGAAVPVTVPESRQVVVVGDGGAVRSTFRVPGSGDQMQPAVAWEGFFYVADDETGVVHVFDGAGREQKSIRFDRPEGPVELDVRESYLFINAPGSSTARVVDDQHAVRSVDKYANDVLGGDPPKTPPPPPPPKPKKPVVSKPGPPRNVHASAGDSEARVTWQAANPNGAAITRYVVTGAGRTFQVGAGQRSVEVTGLTNGETYRFEVHAVNAKGAGPSRTSNAVVPTRDVPDAPASATATAKPDGTVVVTWPKANGQGLDIKQYTVTAITDGSSAPVGQADGTTLTIKAGDLEYGRQYAFTVIAVNERGAGSKPSPISNSVVPYAPPARPDPVDAATVGDQAGAIRVSWSPPADNGRPITGYVVVAGGKSVQVTDGTTATLTGFGDGQTVGVEVRAQNEAGTGAPGTATARTVAKPTVTITGSSATYNAATVTFSVAAGGGTASCAVSADNGGGDASGSCSDLTVRGLKPSTGYTLTVSATNAAGTVTATRTQSTQDLYGTATCNDGEKGDTATYCDADVPGRNGNEVFSVPRQDNTKQVGWAKPGTRLQAYCKKSGEEIYAYIYNDNKRSTWWVQVNYEGRNYIPWAWLNLDGGDDINALATC